MALPGPGCRFLSFSEEHPDGSVPLVLGTGPGGRTARLWVHPDQGRHLAVLGETGMGKSTLLVRLARQVSSGAGVVLFDPIGDTARQFLHSLPAVSRSRAWWVSPYSSPMAINALASAAAGPRSNPGKRDRTIDDLVNALRRVRENRFGDTPFWGPRIEEMTRRALTAASSLPNGTLVDAERLLSASGRTIRGVPPEAQPAVRQLQERVRERPEEVEGSRRLLGEIAGSAVLRRMLCEPQARTAVSEWVEPGRITVISGDASEYGEAAARYFLAVLLALVWSEIMNRSTGLKTVLVLDEAQWYAHETTAEVLRLGRRHNVHLWIATQALASLPESVAEAVRTNSADFVIFRGSPDEARAFHRWLPSVPEESLLSLGAGQALVLTGKGEDVQWVTLARTDPGRMQERTLSDVLEASRAHWAKDRSEETGSGTPAAEDPEEIEGPRDETVHQILMVLWAGLLDSSPGTDLLLNLPMLRETLDPGGEALRIVGGLLSRSGALVETSDGPNGRCWRLRIDTFRSLLPERVDPIELAAATERWKDLAKRGSGSC
ncbi:MAG: DUF87 domain-containing protein [Thermoplasmata archaeon]|nr:DUF87 domain-containing protein [Thermoplasmata archaeon]